MRGGAGVVAWLALAVLGSTALAPGARAADPPATPCEPAYEGVQLLRQRGKLLAARDQAAVCARDVCPEVARRDCARWSEELAREVPSVVVVARDTSDRDVPFTRVLVDGLTRAEAGSGRAFDLDPGAHTFRVERAGAPAVEQSFTVYQGERDRLLRVLVPAAVPAWQPSPRKAPEAPVPSSAPERSSALPPYLVGGISVAVLATSAYLGLTGRQELSSLRSGCAPTCTDDQVNPVRTRLVFSDVALGVGLVGAAVAVTLFALRGSF
ncbi:MAG: hypothetical protein ABSE49_28685 [Polyangiaceae bacterium]